MTHNDSDICLFCGKPYSEHNNGNNEPVTTRVGLCLLLKQGFVSKSSDKANHLRLTQQNRNA